MSDLCSQLAPCPALPAPPSQLERPFDYVSDVRSSSDDDEDEDDDAADDDKKGKSKVSRVCIRRGFLLIFCLCLRLRLRLRRRRLRRSQLLWRAQQNAAYFLGCFWPKYLAAAVVVSISVSIVYCCYCCCLLLFLLSLLLVVSASAAPDKLHIFVLFCFVAISGI